VVETHAMTDTAPANAQNTLWFQLSRLRSRIADLECVGGEGACGTHTCTFCGSVIWHLHQTTPQAQAPRRLTSCQDL
jgi:hypothetical protein